MDRRASLRWMLAAAGAGAAELAGASGIAPPDAARRVGSDPDLLRSWRSGDLWRLTFTEGQRQCAAALAAVIIPADAQSPSAADLHVERFIDEWISAPYPDHARDRERILAGLAWLDAEAERRFGAPFSRASAAHQALLCDALCVQPPANQALAEPAAFFARFRDLTAGGFYTTPQGMADLGFVGNKPSATFDGPPVAVLKLVGLS